MAWHHVEDKVTRAPKYRTKMVNVTKRLPHGGFRTITLNVSTKEPTGEYVEVTHSLYRCGNCRALWCGEKSTKPDGKCQKCGSRG